MSDIQEEMKRQYKRAEENDYDILLSKYNNLKTALDESQEVVISYKEENEKYKKVLDKIKEYLNKVELGELENGKSYTFKDFLKEEKDAENEEAEWLLEFLEEIE